MMGFPLNELRIALDESTKDIILVILVILILIWIIARIVIFIAKRKDGENLDHIWKSFKRAVKKDNVDGINKHGRALIYNSYVSQAQLRLARRLVSKRLKAHPELGELSLLIFNRCLGQ